MIGDFRKRNYQVNDARWAVCDYRDKMLADLIIFKIQLRGEKMDNLQNISVDLFPAEQLVISTPKHP